MWRAFVDLTGTRQSGMSVGPITFLEIQAYRSATLADLTAWEVGLIRRLDQAALAVVAGNAPTHQGSEPQTQVDINDRKGVRGLLSSIGERFRAKKGG